jgi:hypothetical protein
MGMTWHVWISLKSGSSLLTCPARETLPVATLSGTFEHSGPTATQNSDTFSGGLQSLTILNFVCFLLGDSLASEAGKSPRRKHTTFRTGQKFEIENFECSLLPVFRGSMTPDMTDYTGAQKFSVHLMITVQKTRKNVLNSFSHLP